MLYEWNKIFVVVQQIITTLNAARCDHRIDALANRNADLAQPPEIYGGLYGDVLATHSNRRERSQYFPGNFEVTFLAEALQDFGQD